MPNGRKPLPLGRGRGWGGGLPVSGDAGPPGAPGLRRHVRCLLRTGCPRRLQHRRGPGDLALAVFPVRVPGGEGRRSGLGAVVLDADPGAGLPLHHRSRASGLAGERSWSWTWTTGATRSAARTARGISMPPPTATSRRLAEQRRIPRPSPDVLWAARLPMVLLGAGTAALLFVVAAELGGVVGGAGRGGRLRRGAVRSDAAAARPHRGAVPLLPGAGVVAQHAGRARECPHP